MGKTKKELTLSEIEAHLRGIYGSGVAAWPPHLAALFKIATDREQQCKDYDRTLARLSALLTGVAIALKGPEPELVMHDWSDLPELAKAKMEKIAFLEERMKGEGHG